MSEMYTGLCTASGVLSLATIALLFLTEAKRGDTSYTYMSLAAPTLALIHHILYFWDPFPRLSKPVYALAPASPTSIPTPPATPSSTPSDPAATADDIYNSSQPRLSKWVLVRDPTSSHDDATSNPLISSTLNIVFLMLTTVILGALAISIGTVAALNSVEATVPSVGHNYATVELIEGAYYLVTPATTIALVEEVAYADNSLHPTIPAPTASAIGDEVGTTAAVGPSGTQIAVKDDSLPSIPVLVAQSSLALLQTIILANMVLMGLRYSRRWQFDLGGSDVDTEWAYEEYTEDEDEHSEDDK